MRILIVHNQYQIAGGEDEVVKAEQRMLEKFRHEVVLYQRSNRSIDGLSPAEKLRFVLKDVYWSARVYDEIKKVIKDKGIQLVHVHNTFLCVSPSVYQACSDQAVPVVQTLHNYRFLCPIGTFYRQGHLCHDCLNQGRKAAVVNRCWKNSFFASWILKRVVDRHYAMNVFAEKVRHLITLSEFSRQMYIDNGFDREKISVKPNFIDFDPGREVAKEDYAVFVGGFFSYKGIETMLKAWQNVAGKLRLRLIGDGPLFARMRETYQGERIEFLGRKPLSEAMDILKRARFSIVPSECYENFPRIVVESFACGVPVIASRLGALKELVQEGSTGMLFEPGNAQDLTGKLRIFRDDPFKVQSMARNARQEYERKYTMDKNYQILMKIYGSVCEN